MKALIIVDIQNDFLKGGALAVPGGDEIIPRINELQKEHDHVFATKDWHPKDHSSFASEHDKEPFEVIEINGLPQCLWPAHCVQNSCGAEFSPKLETKKIARVFYKGSDKEIDSYSAFFDNAHRKSTGLGEYLKEQGFDELTIVGLATDYCVKYSAFDALSLGFKVNVILDACKGIDVVAGDIERSIEDMHKAGVNIIKQE